jgi:uncharacterized membrane protein
MKSFSREALSAIPLTLSGAAVAAPWLAHFGWMLTALAAYQFFSFVCHQEPARSFWILGLPVAVCVRCLGVYLGAATGALSRWGHVAAIRAVMLAGGLNAADVLAEAWGLHGNLPVPRFILGLALGFAMGALLASGLKLRSSTVRSQPALS